VDFEKIITKSTVPVHHQNCYFSHNKIAKCMAILPINQGIVSLVSVEKRKFCRIPYDYGFEN